jgi:hypothetical protein
MNEFIQMDIFFFITSLIAFLFLFFVSIVGIYVFIIIRRIQKIIREVERFTTQASMVSLDSLTTVKEKIKEILNQGGIIERIVAVVLGTIIAKTFKTRGKIKKDARKK